MTDLLNRAYDPEAFRDAGHALIDLLAKHLQNLQEHTLPTMPWMTPDDQMDYWKNYELGDQPSSKLFQDILDRSINVHHPQFMGHQIAPAAPMAALANLVSGLIANGMAIYEMGPASTAIEQIVCQQIAQKFGLGPDSDGILTSGGTLANLTALLTARAVKAPAKVWNDGHADRLAVMVCEEAHYCIDRAARIMGLGSKGIIKIPATADFRMDTDQLEHHLAKANEKNLYVIAVIGSAPSTSTGTYDDLKAIGQFCQQHDLWFHVDGAHGGAAIYSEKYKHLLDGVELADSIAIDGHKMMMTPSIMTFLLFKDKRTGYQTFSQKAQYLWADAEEAEWHNLAKRTFECTKEMMSIKFFALQQVYGDQLFADFVTNQYDLGQVFAAQVQSHPNMELAHQPDSNIVCFRVTNPTLSPRELDQLNAQIRAEILSDGQFYIVQTTLHDRTWLRVSLMNPMTDSTLIAKLLKRVEYWSQKALITSDK
ncbi:MAG: aminotransferase class I/II-fold pyridoxal phosphate-dependent enzyme [Bacteroidota bacterium]